MSETIGNVQIIEGLDDNTDKLDPTAQDYLDQVSFNIKFLVVKWDDRKNIVFYSSDQPNSNETLDIEQEITCDKESITKHIQKINDCLKRTVVIDSSTNASEVSAQDLRERIRLELAGIGYSLLFEPFIPPKVGENLKAWADESVVFISSNAQWIPWELMHDGEEFLGKRFIMARLPRLKNELQEPQWKEKWRYLPRKPVARQIRQIVHIIGSNLGEESRDNARNIFNQKSPLIVKELDQPSITALNLVLPETDILHFTCHGHLPNKLEQYDQMFLEIHHKDNTKYFLENLSIYKVNQLNVKDVGLVFINACNSAVTVPLFLEDFTSFGWEFYKKGVNVCVGTIGEIAVGYGIEFAEFVYDKLINEYKTIGEAVALAKEYFANRTNCSWLLYCIYGSPDFSVYVS